MCDIRSRTLFDIYLKIFLLLEELWSNPKVYICISIIIQHWINSDGTCHGAAAASSIMSHILGVGTITPPMYQVLVLPWTLNTSHSRPFY